MTRQARAAAIVAAACAVLLAGCGSQSGEAAKPAGATSGATPSATVSATPSPTPTSDSARLAALLPSTKQMEYLLGVLLEREIREDLTQFHEGAAVEAEAGQVGFYRVPGSAGSQAADAGGYVALSMFETGTEATRFLDTNPNFDEDREEPEPEEGVLEVFDLSEVSDEGTGHVFREEGDPPVEHTQGIARIGRYVIEVTLFHRPGLNRIADTRHVVDDFRARLPQNSDQGRAQTPTATPD